MTLRPIYCTPPFNYTTTEIVENRRHSILIKDVTKLPIPGESFIYALLSYHNLLILLCYHFPYMTRPQFLQLFNPKFKATKAGTELKKLAELKLVGIGEYKGMQYIYARRQAYQFVSYYSNKHDAEMLKKKSVTSAPSEQALLRSFMRVQVWLNKLIPYVGGEILSNLRDDDRLVVEDLERFYLPQDYGKSQAGRSLSSLITNWKPLEADEVGYDSRYEVMCQNPRSSLNLHELRAMYDSPFHQWEIFSTYNHVPFEMQKKYADLAFHYVLQALRLKGAYLELFYEEGEESKLILVVTCLHLPQTLRQTYESFLDDFFRIIATRVPYIKAFLQVLTLNAHGANQAEMIVNRVLTDRQKKGLLHHIDSVNYIDLDLSKHWKESSIYTPNANKPKPVTNSAPLESYLD